MIRAAVPADVPEITTVHVRGWQVGYRGQLPSDFLDALDSAARAAWWAKVVLDPAVVVLVSVEQGRVVGFCSFLSSRDDDAPPLTCELATLYVDPEHWRKGHASALVGHAMEVARARGFERLTLWVLESNHAARACYESLGFSADGSAQSHARLGVPIHEVRYHRAL